MKILDMCCGSKMFWYDKNEPHTTYMDIRKETYTAKDRDRIRKIKIDPDIKGDWRKIPFDAETFDLVIFDPPHLMHAGKSSWLAKKYGTLDEAEGLNDIKLGFREAMRVLKPTGTILFKWNQDQIPFSMILKTIAVDGYKPILGDKRSKTRWSVFIKQ